MRLLLSILCTVFAAFALAAYLTIPANPEIRFWQAVDQQRDREIAATRANHPDEPILFFTGGSSCAFSIDPAIIEKTCGLPAYNLGLPYSAGPKYILHQALERTREGDILVIALEPDAVTSPSDFSPSSLALGLATLGGHPGSSAGAATFDERLSIPQYLNLSRPGPEYLATLLAKTLTGRAYRYKSEDIRYHGRIETPISDPTLIPAGPNTATTVCPSGLALLESFKQAADRKHVRLIYSMPWLLTTPDAADHNRSNNRKVLDSISHFIPVVEDGHLGVATDRKYFADTNLHLSAEGSALRSQGLANALQLRLKTSSR